MNSLTEFVDNNGSEALKFANAIKLLFEETDLLSYLDRQDVVVRKCKNKPTELVINYSSFLQESKNNILSAILKYMNTKQFAMSIESIEVTPFTIHIKSFVLQ